VSRQESPEATPRITLRIPRAPGVMTEAECRVFATTAARRFGISGEPEVTPSGERIGLHGMSSDPEGYEFSWPLVTDRLITPSIERRPPPVKRSPSARLSARRLFRLR
jgi:S1-C subfamily serine protease